MPAELPPIASRQLRRHSRRGMSRPRTTSRRPCARPREAPESALCMDFDFGAVSGYAVGAPRTASGVRGQLRVLLRSAGRRARQHAAVQARRRERRERLVGQSSGLRVSARMAARPLQEAAHRVCVGPGDRIASFRRSAQLEFVVAKGSGGGKGTVCFDRLSLPRAACRASSAVGHAGAVPARRWRRRNRRKRSIGAMDTAWRSDPAAGPEQTLILDFQRPREFGGLVLHWLPDAIASRYTIDFSDDGEHWRTVRRGRGRQRRRRPAPAARVGNALCPAALAGRPGEGLCAGGDRSQRSRLRRVAQRVHRSHRQGRASRSLPARRSSGEQSYWTVVGIDGGTAQGLLSEDGALEIGRSPARSNPSCSPTEGLLTWADVEAQTIAARRLSAHPDRDLATRRPCDARDRVRGRHTVPNRS